MSGYRWTCQACQAGNEPNLDKCEFCGCPANAGAEDIERHKNPEGFNRRKTVEEYKRKVLPLLFSPCFFAIYMHSGKVETALLLFVTFFFLITRNIKLLKYIFLNKKAKNILITFSSAMLSFFLARFYLIPHDSPLVGWGLMFYFIFSLGFVLYFSKGNLFNTLFDQYYKKDNEPIK
tara:strand:+ start:3440 stop:3970 length:531 start_codon:yes stop_codon:yes gene_type:complete